MIYYLVPLKGHPVPHVRGIWPWEEKNTGTGAKDMALWLEWLSWHHGVLVHPYIDRTIEPLVSWHDLGMRLQ